MASASSHRKSYDASRLADSCFSQFACYVLTSSASAAQYARQLKTLGLRTYRSRSGVIAKVHGRTSRDRRIEAASLGDEIISDNTGASAVFVANDDMVCLFQEATVHSHNPVITISNLTTVESSSCPYFNTV